MAETNLRYKTLTDLSRILSLFETREIEERSVSDISKSLKMLPSKVSRMLKTLEIEGFVEKNRHTGKFRIGARFLQLGLLYVLNHPLRRIILPHLEKVAKDLGLVAAWGIFKNGRTIVVDRFRLDNRPMIYLLGSEVSLHSSSYGKLFLAYLPEEEQRRILKSLVLVKLAPATIDNLPSMRGGAREGEEEEGMQWTMERRGKGSWAYRRLSSTMPGSLPPPSQSPAMLPISVRIGRPR